MNARFSEANIRGFEFFFEEKASCLNVQDNMLTGMFSLTTRTFIGNQFVRKNLSIRASFLTGELLFEATSGGR